MSRYPIVDSHFYPFQASPVLADATAQKGLLYAKIDLSENGGTYLHLFNTHT